jgi:NitT/TauT family transport system permease protein
MIKIFALRVLVLALFLGIWQFVSGRLVSPFFISSPSAIAKSLYGMAIGGDLFNNMMITASEAAVGFIIGGIAGGLVGLIFGRSPTFASVMNPFITGLYSLPKVALAPLFILWFGVDFKMRVLFTAAIVFFLVFLNTYTGVRSVSRELINVFRLMGAQEMHLTRMVVIPSALTWTLAGLRLSVPYALIGAIVAELMAGNSGLGYLIAHQAAQFDTAGVFAALIGAIALALILNFFVRAVERYAMPWQETERQIEAAV